MFAGRPQMPGHPLCGEAAPGMENLPPILAPRRREPGAAQIRLRRPADSTHAHGAWAWAKPLGSGGAALRRAGPGIQVPQLSLRGEGCRRVSGRASSVGTHGAQAETAPARGVGCLTRHPRRCSAATWSDAGRGRWGACRREGTCVCLWPARTDVWQGPSQFCNYPPIK